MCIHNQEVPVFEDPKGCGWEEWPICKALNQKADKVVLFSEKRPVEEVQIFNVSTGAKVYLCIAIALIGIPAHLVFQYLDYVMGISPAG